MGIVHRDLKPANLFCARRPNGQTLCQGPRLRHFEVDRCRGRRGRTYDHRDGGADGIASLHVARADALDEGRRRAERHLGASGSCCSSSSAARLPSTAPPSPRSPSRLLPSPRRRSGCSARTSRPRSGRPSFSAASRRTAADACARSSIWRAKRWLPLGSLRARLSLERIAGPLARGVAPRTQGPSADRDAPGSGDP